MDGNEVLLIKLICLIFMRLGRLEGMRAKIKDIYRHSYFAAIFAWVSVFLGMVVFFITAVQINEIKRRKLRSLRSSPSSQQSVSQVSVSQKMEQLFPFERFTFSRPLPKDFWRDSPATESSLERAKWRKCRDFLLLEARQLEEEGIGELAYALWEGNSLSGKTLERLKRAKKIYLLLSCLKKAKNIQKKINLIFQKCPPIKEFFEYR
ncbi:MAG: hypothetical protein D6805_10120 [Planctomycetota bacterium]|nr:MAG: hypothetical protein D6805_10120 [Planctomycetota bacterium]